MISLDLLPQQQQMLPLLLSLFLLLLDVVERRRCKAHDAIAEDSEERPVSSARGRTLRRANGDSCCCCDWLLPR